MKTYSRARAAKAVAQKILDNHEVAGEITTPATEDGKFSIHIDFPAGTAIDEFLAADLDGISWLRPAVEEPVQVNLDGDDQPADKPKPAKTPRQPKAAHVNASSIEKPVETVHRIAQTMFEANPEVTRKEILVACREAGVATHTAATQYARWRTNRIKTAI